MQVRTEKAPWFVLASCALAALPLACRSESRVATKGACAGAGIVSSRRLTRVDGSELAVEIVQTGCSGCAQSVRPGAPPGGLCQAASVCAEVCCKCPNVMENMRYRARVCEAGVCANVHSACATARSSIAPDVCLAP